MYSYLCLWDIFLFITFNISHPHLTVSRTFFVGPLKVSKIRLVFLSVIPRIFLNERFCMNLFFSCGYKDKRNLHFLLFLTVWTYLKRIANCWVDSPKYCTVYCTLNSNLLNFLVDGNEYFGTYHPGACVYYIIGPEYWVLCGRGRSCPGSRGAHLLRGADPLLADPQVSGHTGTRGQVPPGHTRPEGEGAEAACFCTKFRCREATVEHGMLQLFWESLFAGRTESNQLHGHFPNLSCMAWS